ncbi:DNA-binding domain of ModE / Molybdate-binding domain of ModE [Thioalkalivibrio nitratireducens DSM 14787]|uniref:DNA-binding domain of ModE / Molybdate-binding domain of ModE n=1 Tax=Thioalkalivibrio nitratireducens (strain DSM 14787 / UNIQEM 213 / ALEN2) TaxID=1255043 RepID=L0DUI4_THIND|nr:TOBE domain-containing protein [Thioalkalivibrio nitratireducens]AGA32655.1 DNA-binding domain of ModE / Molybdate-binding domain of ModE [Thioalkalivibrio nitratireducens DSM 14787]
MRPDVDGRFWLNIEGKGFLGLGRIELLEQIGATGSISAAARKMGMSYKTAWDAIDAMNNLADEPLLIRQVGGRHGGGTRLTEYGKRVTRQYRAAEHEYQRFIDVMREQLAHLGLKEPPDGWSFIRRMAMRTSARNQFQGKVARFTEGAVNDVITVDIGGGIEISSVVTHEAAQSLDLLREGREVQALIKASFVILCEDVEGMRFSARNRLCGIVSRVQPGAVNAEVKLDLSAGRTLTSIVTMDAVNEGWLKEGGRVCALIKAPHVVLAVSD